MGNALHRLEVLLVGLVLLLAGAIVVVLLLVRPASPSGYVQTTPRPIGTSVAAQPTSAPVSAAAVAAAGAATAIPIPTAAPAATSAPIMLAPTQIASTAAPSGAPTRTWTIPPILIASWPYLLLTVGLGGLTLVVGRSIRKRRIPATNQSVRQLLAVADPVTRESNMRVMQNLSKQGLLTRDLAAAAGIHQPGWRRQIQVPQIRIPRPPLPTLRLPTISVPKPSLPRLRLPRRHQRPLTIDCAPAIPTLDLAVEAPAQEPQPVPTPTPIRDLGVASLSDESAPMIDTVALREALTAQDVEVPSIELLPSADAQVGDHSETWTAEDRVLAVAGVLAEIWAAEELTSPILTLDTPIMPGNGSVVVTIDQHPDEEERIVDLPDRITAQRSTWRASWRQDKLTIEVMTSGARPPAGGPLIVPILTHGRGGKTTRFYPLASWRHLGLYGGQALPALHALLGSLLYNQPPSHVALAILDHGEISPLYRSVAHLVPLPGTTAATLDQLTRILRRPPARGDVRPLLLVVVEPDTALLSALTTLLTRLRQQPGTPLHLLLVQERLLPAGHELYAMLPALITSGGRGPAALLPGQGNWPRPGEVRLVGHGMRLEGRPMTIDEVDAASQFAHLRGNAVGLLPVLWDVQAQAMAVTVPDHEPGREGDLFHDEEWLEEEGPLNTRQPDQGEHADAVYADDPDSQQHQIAQALVAQRQWLIDQEGQIPALLASASAGPAVAQAPEIADPDTSTIETPAADMIVSDALGSVMDMDVASALEQPTADEVSIVQEPMHGDTTGEVVTVDTPFASMLAGDDVASLPLLAPAADAMAIGQVHEPVTAVDLPGPGPDDDAKPRSRRAALLRLAIAAGQPDAPPLQAMLPQRKETDTSLSAAPSSPTSGRLPADHAPEPQPIAEPDNGWPIGPSPLGRVAMAELMARVASAPAIIAGQLNEQGVTKNRLVELLKGTHKAQAKELAEVLMAWFDLAGLLVEPTRPGRLRHPRALTTMNLAEIAEKLNATPCPDKGRVKEMWVASNEGRD